MKNTPGLSGLKLANFCTKGETLGVDILVGSDYYWKLVTSHTIKGAQGPTALHSKLGWVLLGPVCTGRVQNQKRSNPVTTHVLKCTIDQMSYDGLQGELKTFWDLESLGGKPPSVYEEFVEKLFYKGDHYEFSLSWKATHPPLPENYELSLQRLQGLLSRLREKSGILKEYDSGSCE